MVSLGLSGKAAIVTGGGAGLGRTYARGLAAEGVAIAVTDLDTASAKSVVSEIETAGGRAIAVELDVTDEEAADRAVITTESEFGRLDILVNNAGWRPIPAGHHYDDIPNDIQNADQWRRIFDVNVMGSLICARAVRAAMARQGGGTIVNATSMAAFQKPAGAYGVSKLACAGLTTSLAAELAPDNIRVNGIAPGVMTHRLNNEDVSRMILEGQLIKRKGTPEDLIGALIYFCSDMSGFVTGVNLLVDGGSVLRP